MGILVNTAYLMMLEGNRKPFTGSVLQLGRQSVLFSYATLQLIALHTNFRLKDIEVHDINARLTDEQFFKSLGFEEVLSMEYGTNENATYVWDMNHPTPPFGMGGLISSTMVVL